MNSIGSIIEEVQEARVVEKWRREEMREIESSYVALSYPEEPTYEDLMIWAQYPSTLDEKDWNSYLEEHYASNCFWSWRDSSEGIQAILEDYKYPASISFRRIDSWWAVFEAEGFTIEELLMSIMAIVLLQQRVTMAEVDRVIYGARLLDPVEFPADLGELLDRRGWRPMNR